MSSISQEWFAKGHFFCPWSESLFLDIQEGRCDIFCEKLSSLTQGIGLVLSRVLVQRAGDTLTPTHQLTMLSVVWGLGFQDEDCLGMRVVRGSGCSGLFRADKGSGPFRV